VQHRKRAGGASKVPAQCRILFRQVRKSGVVGSRSCACRRAIAHSMSAVRRETRHRCAPPPRRRARRFV